VGQQAGVGQFGGVLRGRGLALDYQLREGVKQTVYTILAHVCNSDIDLASDTVTCHIASLRRKLRVGSRRPLIHTLPGNGYKIDLTEPSPITPTGATP